SPSAPSTSPRTDVARPPSVNPAYMALPRLKSNAAHGPVSCGCNHVLDLPKSGSEPCAACVLYRCTVCSSVAASTPRACAISATVPQPSTNGASGNCGCSTCSESTIRYAVDSGCSSTKPDVLA